MLLYYITDRAQLLDPSRLIARIAEAAHAGIDYIQLRGEGLTTRAFEAVAREAVDAVRGTTTTLLVGSRTDVAMAVGARGVHLTPEDISAADARAIWKTTHPVIAVSCHSSAEVRMAESQGADFAVLAPMFNEGTTPGLGVHVLTQACGRAIPPLHTESAPRPSQFPVLASGGLTLENARLCLQAGAAGVAATRLFQENDVREVVKRLRAYS